MVKDLLSADEFKATASIKQYLERMFEIHKSHTSCSTDHSIDCPQGHYRGLQFDYRILDEGNGAWRCLMLKCPYNGGLRFPASVNPPGPQEFLDYLDQQDKNKIAQSISVLARHLGARIC